MKSSGAMSDVERARTYRKKRGPQISRARKKQRKAAAKTAKRAATIAHHDVRKAEMAAAAERASAQLAKGDRKFAFILADPPTIWLGGQGRAAPYGCMTLAAICAIRVPAAAAAVLWMWSTRPLLIRAPHLIIPAWGFEDFDQLGVGEDRSGRRRARKWHWPRAARPARDPDPLHARQGGQTGRVG